MLLQARLHHLTERRLRHALLLLLRLLLLRHLLPR
jgi:hypothetical protein